MSQPRTDAERVLKLIERTRLLVAIDDDMPTDVKLNAQPLLKMLEAAVAAEEIDEPLASGYFTQLYTELATSPDCEALLSAMRVFLPFL